MTVKQFSEALSLEVLSAGDMQREIRGAYAGDLLSWVMGRAGQDSVWATIMTNINVVAVASLADVSATVICENSEVSDEVIKTAEEKSVALFRTPMPMYEFCVATSNLLK